MDKKYELIRAVQTLQTSYPSTSLMSWTWIESVDLAVAEEVW